MSAGHGGQVLLSQTTRDLVGTEVEVRDLGEHRLKDLAEPEWLFQLGSQEFPPLKTISNTNLPVPANRFVGREEELVALRALSFGLPRALELPEVPPIAINRARGCHPRLPSRV